MKQCKIIEDIINNNIYMAIALKRILIIASNINNSDLSQRVEKELKGYEETDIFPEYRIIKDPKFIYSGVYLGCQITDMHLDLLRVIYGNNQQNAIARIRFNISFIEEIINKTEKEYRIDYSKFAGIVYKNTGIRCYSIYLLINKNILKNIIESLKVYLLKKLARLNQQIGNIDQYDIIAQEDISKESQQYNTMTTIIHKGDYINIDGENKILNSNIGNNKLSSKIEKSEGKIKQNHYISIIIGIVTSIIGAIIYNKIEIIKEYAKEVIHFIVK